MNVGIMRVQNVLATAGLGVAADIVTELRTINQRANSHSRF